MDAWTDGQMNTHFVSKCGQLVYIFEIVPISCNFVVTFLPYIFACRGSLSRFEFRFVDLFCLYICLVCTKGSCLQSSLIHSAKVYQLLLSVIVCSSACRIGI
jgi:hypothetical protein